ncbi:MAG: hypothetical protein ACT4PM_06845 [Gemmatimonadales bacterium]
MARTPITRLLSAAFIVLMSGGGGDLPALDGLLFHIRERVSVSLPAHFESSSACHGDQCAIRSTAAQTRLASLPPAPAEALVEPPLTTAVLGDSELRADRALTQPFSRAPPTFLSR